MHAKIIQIAKNTEPSGELSADSFYYDEEWFAHEIADYVDNLTDEEQELCREGFIRYRGFKPLDDDNIAFEVTKEVKDAFIQKKYELLKENVERLQSKLTPKAIENGDVDSELWRMQTSYEDKFGTYVYYSEQPRGFYSPGYELMTFDSWLRTCEPGTYYIGTVLDYHF